MRREGRIKGRKQGRKEGRKERRRKQKESRRYGAGARKIRTSGEDNVGKW